MSGALGSISRELLSTQQENRCRSSHLRTQNLADALLGLFCFGVCVRVVRGSLIETILPNWDIMHIVYYFQLLWKSQEIWPRFLKTTKWVENGTQDMVTRLSSPPSLPDPFHLPAQTTWLSFITVRDAICLIVETLFSVFTSLLNVGK